MNVYVLQQARELGRRGIPTDVYTRWHDADHPDVVDLGENSRLIHIEACAKSRPKEFLGECVPEFVDRVGGLSKSQGIEYGLIHSHYWLSGLAALSLAERWDVPHVASFHTLARTKLRARSEEKEAEGRPEAEQAVMKKADAVVVTTEQERIDLERLYHVDGGNIRVIPAGVDLELFRPMNQAEAKDILGWNGQPTILYVGRIEPLKGVELVVRALARMETADGVRFVVAGGDPGFDGHLDELKRVAPICWSRRQGSVCWLCRACRTADVLQRRRCVCAAFLLRELWASGAGGHGLRDARRGIWSGWTAVLHRQR